MSLQFPKIKLKVEINNKNKFNFKIIENNLIIKKFIKYSFKFSNLLLNLKN